MAKIKAKAAETSREGTRAGGRATGKSVKGKAYYASARAHDQRLAARASASAARDTWEGLLLTRLAAVASPGSLGYALVQSGETDSWYHSIVAALVGQSKIVKGATLKTRGIHADLTWKLANSMSKAARGKPKGIT